LRIFLDTNVLISAFISRGLCADLLRIIIAEHHLIVGDLVLSEMKIVLLEKFSMPEKQIQNIISFLESFEKCVYTGEKPSISLRDKDDEKILAIALKSNVDVFVTGDKDILDARKEIPISVLDPKEFLHLIKTK
jgi:putative PIN family toxin of toxin-antitoxin system